ncbi:MAG: PKD domain-containing protein, partial [Nitrososphaeraceae archaeon]
SRSTSDEEDDESSRSTSDESTGEIYYKKPNVLSTNELTGNKIIGNSIDNENNKLMSQFSELNSSIMSKTRINSEEDILKINDKKPIANAGLDQVIKGDENIVLDASSSFDPEGKIINYLWKQTGTSEDKIKSSNSMIYSFPIPEGLEEKSLEFKLIVMDEKGQKDTDTINFLLNQENDEESKT